MPIDRPYSNNPWLAGGLLFELALVAFHNVLDWRCVLQAYLFSPPMSTLTSLLPQPTSKWLCYGSPVFCLTATAGGTAGMSNQAIATDMDFSIQCRSNVFDHHRAVVQKWSNRNFVDSLHVN